MLLPRLIMASKPRWPDLYISSHGRKAFSGSSKRPGRGIGSSNSCAAENSLDRFMDQRQMSLSSMYRKIKGQLCRGLN
eukprot:Skav228188  [mRNA]  locus=scaffold3933:472477:479423:- [translate_table: standard]